MLEHEVAFNIPATSGAFFFAGTYASTSGSSADESWNEIDQAVIYGSADLEYHASFLMATPSSPTVYDEDKAC